MTAKKKYDIIILTDFYPGFIFNEEQELIRQDKKYLILTQKIDPKFSGNKNVILLERKKSKLSFFPTIIYLLLKFGSFRRIIFNTKYNNWLKFKSTFVWVQDAYSYYRQIEKICILDSSSVVYSFWGDEKAICAVLLSIKYKVVSYTRLHGWDLYHERHRLDKIPLRPVLNKYIQHLIFISENGQNYYLDEFPEMKEKTSVFYLGTREPLEKKIPEGSESSNLVIVSCSFLTPVKRIEVLYEALAELIKEGLKLTWHHLGGGETLEDFKLKIENDNLSDQIVFHGNMLNEDIHAFFATNKIDLFINVSESEGLPVSIMEAMSYGISCVGPEVGGIPEVIKHNQNGFLTGFYPSVQQIKQSLMDFSRLTENEKERFSRNAFETWKTKFNSDTNSRRFFEKFLN